jgi:hypothetical protein
LVACCTGNNLLNRRHSDWLVIAFALDRQTFETASSDEIDPKVTSHRREVDGPTSRIPKRSTGATTRFFPAIRAEAKKASATIYFADEAGIGSDYHSGTTWAPVGQTPVVRSTDYRKLSDPNRPRQYQGVRYPHIHVQLTGQDGNAYAILGAVRRALVQAGVPRDEVAAFIREATSRDYNHLLATAMATVDVQCGA